MTTKTPDSQVVTLINVMKVAPENQQQLVDLVVQAARDYLRHQPGFISSRIHKSIDGTKVATYVQWEDRAKFDEMLQNTGGIPYAQAVLKIASVEPCLYEVTALVDDEA
jgi:quinol monooxygenase YgiN